MKNGIIAILTSFSLLLTSCSGEGGCEMQYDNSKSLGTISLEPESANWLPQPGVKTLYFKNNMGVLWAFKISRNSNDNKYNLYRNHDLSGGPCTTEGYVYVNCERPEFQLFSLEVPIGISLGRIKNIREYYMSDTIKLDDLNKVTDRIRVQVGMDANSFNLTDTAQFLIGDVFLVDSIYNNVYRIPGFNSIQPKLTEYFYLQRGKGLIGLKFTNGETWAIR